MVTARTSIREGFRLARQSCGAVWMLFAANLLLAIIAALPIFHGILDFTSQSLMARDLLTGFSFDWFTDFTFNRGAAIQQYAQFIMIMGMIALPVNAILAGGVLARFQNPQERFRLGSFFRDCGRYTWRMLWLMVFALIAFWAAFHFVHAGLGGFVNRKTLYWTDDRTAFLAQLGAGLLLLLALAFINLVIEFAQVRIVYVEGAGAIDSLLAALGFAIARLPKAVVVYVVPSFGGLALLGIYRLVTPWSLIHSSLGGSAASSYEPALVLSLLFMGQQLVMFGRYWFRVATWASEWSLYHGTRTPRPLTSRLKDAPRNRSDFMPPVNGFDARGSAGWTGHRPGGQRFSVL
ncbi:MAG TPA: hypothetical protein VFC10_18310 [Terriglobia bacterium]|nr:hypothetical protein [Terriglobia bacterium]